MAEDQSKENQNFDFTTEGEVTGEYGRRYRNVAMAFEAVEAIEAEDSYTITLSFRPQGDFAGTPGQEQFFVEKEGRITARQVLSLPRRGRRFPVLPIAIGVVIVGVIVAVAAVFMLGGTGDDGASVGALTGAAAGVTTDNPEDSSASTIMPSATAKPANPQFSNTSPGPAYTPQPTVTAEGVLVTSTPSPFPSSDAISYFKKGEAYNHDGKYRPAVEEFTTAIRLNSRYTSAYWARGWAYDYLDQYQQAIQDFDKAIQLDPLRQHDGMAYEGRGLAYRMLGRNAEADADKAKACSPNIDYC